MSNYKIIQEFGLIKRQRDFPERQDGFSEIFLKDTAFDSLYDFVAENQEHGEEANRAFSIQKRRGKEVIQVKNYVGIVETRDGTGIEILPKIYQKNETDRGEEAAIRACRKQLLKMLRCLRDLQPIRIEEAHLQIHHFPLLEIFITAFLEELEELIKGGIQKDYALIQTHSNFIKGRLLFTQQLRENLTHPERFAVEYDEFQVDIPQNRLLKSALLKLRKESRTRKNQNRIRRALSLFQEVGDSLDFEQDFQKTQTPNRLFNRYRRLLSWARVFLLNQAFTHFKGKHLNRAILFPMERIFEDYVGAAFKRLRNREDELYEVHLQDKRHFLIDNHRGQQQFRLRPDVVLFEKEIQNGGIPPKRICHILDTKWKIIDALASRKNYQLSQSDLYQLFAYGKKYQQAYNSDEMNGEYSKVQLYLIYPKHPEFTEAIPSFYYDGDLELKVLPFDWDLGLEAAVKKIIS